MTYFILGYFIILFALLVAVVVTFYIVKWVGRSCVTITIEFTIHIEPYVQHVNYLKIGYEYINDISTLLNSRSISQYCSVYQYYSSITGTIKYNSGIRRKMNNFEATAIELFDSKYKNKNLILSSFSVS